MLSQQIFIGTNCVDVRLLWFMVYKNTKPLSIDLRLHTLSIMSIMRVSNGLGAFDRVPNTVWNGGGGQRGGGGVQSFVFFTTAATNLVI